jgi:hypothetical protein
LGGTRAAAAEELYPLNQCYGGNGSCPNAGPYGDVTVSAISGGISVTLDLASGESYTNAGSGGMQALLFDLPGTTIEVTNVTAGFTPANSTKNAQGYVLTSGSIHADGSGTWDFGIMCTVCGSGNSNPVSTPLTFDVIGSGLTPTSFTLDKANGQNPAAYFTTDVAIPPSFTGDVGSTTRSVVPLPPSFLLLASALVGLALLLRRPTPAAARFRR